MASKWQVWYPHLIDAWQGSATIQTFSHAASRGYHNLIMEQFQAPDGMLPDDDRQLARMSRLGLEWTSVAHEVREVLKPNGAGRIYSETQFKLWQEAQERHDSYLSRTEQMRKARFVKNSAQDSAQNSAQTENGLTGKETGKETKTEKTTKAKAAPPEAPLFVLPEWIERDVWAAFEEMRRATKHPLTDYARRKIVGKLIKLEAQGFKAEDLLNDAIVNCWRDVYAPRDAAPARPALPTPAEVKARVAIVEAAEAENYLAWQSTSDEYKRANPWTGKKYEVQ